MSKEKYIQQTLTLPAELPLFNYNINFDGLRKILEGVNVKTNNNEEEIKKLQEVMATKLPIVSLSQTEKKLNSSYLFGVRSQNYIDVQEEKVVKAHKTEVKDLPEVDQFCWKMNRMAEIVQFLFNKYETHEEKIGSDNKRYQKMVDDSFRRLQDKLNSNIDSFSKTINSYFTQTNEKVSQLQSGLNTLKLNTEGKVADLSGEMSKKISENSLKAMIDASQQRVKKDLENALKNDQMQRMSTVNELKNSIKESEKDLDLKNKSMAMKMQQLTQKVTKALLVSNFEIEKHKIYERLSELKNRSDDLFRKNNQFVDFRKAYLANNERTKQDIIGLNDEIQKMNQKETSFKKMENMSDILSSLNPHLICELGEEVKLHEKEIGKLEKQLLTLENELRTRENENKPKVQVNSGQNSDLIQKIIKEFMSNMDFEGRVKRSERDIVELKKRNDTFTELEKKIYMLSKEMDMGAVMKELRKKCDEENTRKDTKILDGKIEQLFEFYKQLRKQMEQKRKMSKNEPYQNASLTTKKLISANCLSCNPSTPSTRRNYSRNKLQMSLDYGVESQKNTIYSRMAK